MSVAVAFAFAPAAARSATREVLAGLPGYDQSGNSVAATGGDGWMVVVEAVGGSTMIVKLHHGVVSAAVRTHQPGYFDPSITLLAAAIDRRGDVVVVSDIGADDFFDIVVGRWPAGGRLLPWRRVVSVNTSCSGCMEPYEYAWAAVDRRGGVVVAASAVGNLAILSGTIAGRLTRVRLPGSILTSLAVRMGLDGRPQVVWSSAGRSGQTSAIELSVVSAGRFERTRTLLAFDRRDAWDGGYPTAREDGLLDFQWGSGGGWIAGWPGVTGRSYVAVSRGSGVGGPGTRTDAGEGDLQPVPGSPIGGGLTAVGLGPDGRGLVVWTAQTIPPDQEIGTLHARGITPSGWTGRARRLGESSTGVLSYGTALPIALDVGQRGSFAAAYIDDRQRIVTVVCRLGGSCAPQPIGDGHDHAGPLIAQLTRAGARITFEDAAGDVLQADVRL